MFRIQIIISIVDINSKLFINPMVIYGEISCVHSQ